MRIDIDLLVAPLSEEAPSGPDLYDDPERQEIEAAFERSISEGESSGSGEEIDWPGLVRRIAAQAEQTRDLWLATYMMRAAAQAGDFDMVVQGGEFLARLCEDRWADVHPQLEELGFIGRKTPCEPLTRLGEFITPLRSVPILIHPRLGSYSGADFELFADQGGNADNYGMFRTLIDATPPEEIEAVVERIDALAASIRRVDAVMTANAEGDTATNFEPTYKALKEMREAVALYAPRPADEAAAGDSDDVDGGDGGSASAARQGSGKSFSGAINNRDDVVRAIDSICAYYSRFEPSSPVPFALRRAKEWISLDFMALLEDISPNSITEAGTVLQIQRQPATGSDSWGSDDSWSSGEESSSDDGWS